MNDGIFIDEAKAILEARHKKGGPFSESEEELTKLLRIIETNPELLGLGMIKYKLCIHIINARVPVARGFIEKVDKGVKYDDYESY